MFKILDEKFEESVAMYQKIIHDSSEIPLNEATYEHPALFDETGKEFWVKVEILTPMGMDRLMALANGKVEGSEYLGFQIKRISDQNLVDIREYKDRIHKFIADL